MKKKLYRVTCTIIPVILLFFSYVSPVFAYLKPELSLTLSKSSTDEYTVSLHLVNATDVVSIDFTVLLEENDFNFEDCLIKADNSADVNDEYSENNKFIYHFDKQECKLSFSGFFTDKTEKNEKIHLCDITVSKKQDVSENAALELIYSLSTKNYTVPHRAVFSLESGEKTAENNIFAYPLGDADADGKITANDARKILRTSVGLENTELAVFPYADTDHDGKISAADARNALRSSVGLEETVLHSFSIQLKNGATCNDGGEYFFFCSLTNTSYSVKSEATAHKFRSKDCIHNKECTICGEISEYSDGHDFSDEDICTQCGQEKNDFVNIKETLIPLMKIVTNYDITADSAADSKDYSTFIKNAVQAEKQLKICTDSIQDINGAYEIYQELKKAYSIRFEAFLQCTNEYGNIPLTEDSFNIINDAVRMSMRYINHIYAVFG